MRVIIARVDIIRWLSGLIVDQNLTDDQLCYLYRFTVSHDRKVMLEMSKLLLASNACNTFELGYKVPMNEERQSRIGFSF